MYSNSVGHRRSVSFDVAFHSHFTQELSPGSLPLRTSQNTLSPEKIQEAVSAPVSSASTPSTGRFKPSSSLSPADNGRINDALVEAGLISLSSRLEQDIKQYDEAWEKFDTRADQIIESTFRNKRILGIHIS
jgi:hypothetical protein